MMMKNFISQFYRFANKYMNVQNDVVVINVAIYFLMLLDHLTINSSKAARCGAARRPLFIRTISFKLVDHHLPPLQTNLSHRRPDALCTYSDGWSGAIGLV